MDEPEVTDHTALHDSSSIRMEWVEGRKHGYTREDAYRVLAGLPPRGTVNVTHTALDQTRDPRTPEEVDRDFAGLHGPRLDRDDEA